MRALHQLYAWALGYFWLPCPVCGRMFGGHEVRADHVSVLVPTPGNPQRRQVACPKHRIRGYWR